MLRFSSGGFQAVRIAKEWIEQRPVYLDTETTGLSPFDVVIEVAVVDSDGRVLLDTLVKNIRPVPADATRIHGLTETHLKQAPDWGQVWEELNKVLAGRAVGIFNASYDLRLLRQTCGQSGIGWAPSYGQNFCIMELFARHHGELMGARPPYRWRSLDFAGRYFNLPDPNAHRAREDAQLSKSVLEAIAKL